ncbi:helix-turn-helix transcriptional regulator [Breznakia pachnodae]|uniref:DNA-binding transcriptional regulator YafY n=1 Tax=Breznakia pachnodae TaxID=265178 RepID=A0ABU0E6V8_9FIRM|nr:YafY family protein [Breznakia pachnodae]MDQ0362637.1 putative DNA-binding transcriptional regulator YafY [Breznakia pachnodae]
MRSSRMFEIMNLLIHNERMTAVQLAEKLKVSKRTVYRDIEALNEAGVPVVHFSGKDGGLGISEDYKIDKSFLSTDELKSILVGLNALREVDKTNELNTMIAKLPVKSREEVIDNGDTIIDLSSWFDDHPLRDYISNLRTAIRNHNIIIVTYQVKDGYSKREIEPYRLLFKYSAWYMYAYCEEVNEFRLFKLNRIIKYKILNDKFIVKDYQIEDIRLLFDKQYFNLDQQENVMKVILKYNKVDEAYLVDRMGTQKFVFDLENQTISFITGDMPWVVNFLMGLEDKAKVISPLSLQEKVRKRINKMNKLYES